MKRRAIPHLERAQALEPDLAEANAGWALLELNTYDPESAIMHARKALASNPSYGDAMNWLSIALGDLGRYEEGFETLEQMLVRDPLNLVGRWNYIRELWFRGRVEEAHDMTDQLLTDSPRRGYMQHSERSYLGEGKIAEGLFWRLRARAENPSDTHGTSDQVLGFIWVGEYDEARRVNDELTYRVDVAEGRFDEAIQATQMRMRLDPYSEQAIGAAANVLYDAGRIDEALPLYERLRELVPEGRPLTPSEEIDIRSWETMRLALARRKAGDEDAAQTAVEIVRNDYAARRVAGYKSQYEHRAEAMIAAFERNPDRVIAALRSAIQLGLRIRQVFVDPIFEDLWGEPRFVALQKELDAILAVEHDKVLQLICFNNPTPDNWQPLPETCDGVEDQSRLQVPE